MSNVDALSRLPLEEYIEVDKDAINRFSVTHEVDITLQEVKAAIKVDEVSYGL